MFLCMVCDNTFPDDQRDVESLVSICTDCSAIENGFYAKPEEYLPNSYFDWLKSQYKSLSGRGIDIEEYNP